jgi:Protein of unknown function (DUF732)
MSSSTTSTASASVTATTPTTSTWGFGNAICWRLYTGEAPAQIADSVFANSRTGKQTELTHDQSDAAVRFAHADLCPDAEPKS